MRRWLRHVGSLAGLLVLLSCGSSPRPTFYTLFDGGQFVSARGQSVRIAVMPTALPELVDRPQLVVRRADQRVQVLEQRRWAEPLRQEISRLLAGDLAHRLGSALVVALPDDVQALDPDFRLFLDVQRLDATREQLALDVVWRIVPRQGLPRYGRSSLVEAVTDKATEPYAALVGAYRRAFARVADDLAGAFRQPVPQ